MTGAYDVEGLTAFSTSGFLQLFGIVFIAVGIVASIASLVKNVLNILSPDNYALDMYDKIKRRAEEPKRRRAYYASSSYWIIIGIIYEILAIFLSTVMGRALGGRYITSYFSLISGVSGWCVLFIIVLLAAVAMFIWSKVIKNNIRIAIMREDYNVNDNVNANI